MKKEKSLDFLSVEVLAMRAQQKDILALIDEVKMEKRITLVENRVAALERYTRMKMNDLIS